MTRIALPSGGWAETSIDPAKLKQRDLDEYCLAAETDETGWKRNFVVRAAQLSLVVDKWSFDMPVPRDDPKSIDELTPADCQALRAWYIENVDPVFFPEEQAVQDPMDPLVERPG